MAEQSQEQLQRQFSPSSDHLLKVVDSAAPPPSKKSDGNTTFLRAARSGNLERVLEFINANVDINTSNSNGLNALHLASKDGHKEVVAELLKRGANVDAATKKGNTALHIASLAGQEEVVKLLIENGATVNVQSQSGFTPLYMAAQENHERVVRYLLNNGANQSLATEDGFTPLAVAMQQGHEKVVTELLENDTRGKIRLPALHIAAKKDDCKAAALLLQSEHNNPDITSKSGFTPLHIASHYGNDAIASLLLAKGADVNYSAKHNITPLHVAAKWGRNNMVLLLLDKGASIVAKTRDGLTPLHCAARSGHEQVVDTLLQRHAPITAKTKNGLAPLHMASQGDHVEAARVLLQHRAPVDDVTVDYLTALHVASHCGHVSVAKLLLDRKADPNARALNGFTPLHIACKKNRVKVVELLLKHGASIESTTESGLSPLHVASFMGCMNIVIYLLQCEANPDVSTIRGETPLHLASRANQTDIIRILLRNGAQVDAKAREQQTPLHIAARLGNQDIVMLLLQHGASVDSATKDQYTSLHIAAKEDQEEVAQVLLDNNASMTATTKKGFTPLHLAAKYGRTKIATLLLHRGAPVDAQGKNGVTPLHVASHYDHQGIALLLLDKGASPHAIAKNGHTPLHIAAKKNQMDIAAMLLEYGASAEVESKAGFTPLHLSAQEGHADMTNLLLEHKSAVNHSSKNGLTPLHLCAQEDCVEVAKILVQNGADMNAVTKAGYTPLHIASHFGQLNMVRYLLSQKVKVDPTTSTGYTPLHQAAQQGNSAIVAVLLDNGASPDSKNNQDQTALCIAQKLGYISVVEVLKNVTEASKAPSAAAGNEEKYKVVAPETMQENFMSDSEDEGGDDVVNEQSYRYLTIDEMKSLGDDSLPLDVTREDRYDTTAGIDESISPQHTYSQMNAAPPALDNVDVSRGPIVQSGFLVSFLVDAKGGAMRGCRHSGVRVIVPPQCVTMPTRVTCRYVRRDKPNHPPPPPLMEGEALASRILELGPVGVKFLGPVVIEVPNFAALRGNEREIVILRSDNGETWREHTVDSSNEAVQEILSRSFDKDGNQIQVDEPGRITSIVTHDFPHYFAVVSRIRQEVHAIGPEGGMVSSSVVPQVQAVFPPGALTKKIKVGLQAQPIPSDLTAAVLGNCVAVSPIVTIEPRRRKFHKPITLTLPVPQAANKGMINQYSGDAPTLRLLCSITGGTSRAQWEDVTGSTPLTFVKECVSFTTTVSARFWLMDVRDIAIATKKATELYREAIHIPFMAKFVVFAKRVDNNEARLRVFCMTDDKEDKTLECQEHFIEVAKSRDVEVLEGKQQLVELSGNLISVTKSGDQLRLGFHAFQENRLPFTVRLKDSHSDPIGRMLFFKEQKPVKMSTPHPPVCVLNIVLPDGIVPDHDLLDSPMRNYSYTNDVQGYHRSELRFSDISNLIGEDWLPLSEKLGINSAEAAVIKSEYPESVPKQALTMLRIWHQQAGNKASANILESALLSIGRDDIVQECILNTTDMSKRKLFENGMQPSKSVMSEIIEDYQIGKHDISSTDDDEKKYTAEEKVVFDDEPSKSVSERTTEIEKRLQSEPSKRSSKELYDGIEKRNSDKEPVVKRQSSQSKDVIKSCEGVESFEPTTLTFEQKRLSFERGLSFDKDPSKGNAVDKFIQIEKSEPRHDVKSSAKKEKIMQIDKENLKIDKKDHETRSNEPVEHFHIVKEVAKDSDYQFVRKELSFTEKRLSFELGGDAKIPDSDSKSTSKAKADDPRSTKSEGERRDSELFEGVSLGLGKLEAKSTVTEKDFLSPKPLKTPPPSPAEFKSESLQKQDSEESGKSEALPDKCATDVIESSSKSSDRSSGDKRQRSYAEKETPPVSPRDGVPKVDTDKGECTDYFSKKKFWQSFESTTATNTVGPDSKLSAPVPKPRASICISGLSDAPDTALVPPSVSRRSSENISRVSVQPVRKDKLVNKSESADNVLLESATEGSSRSKPSLRQIHSLTACSTDSEAEYVATCGVEKLAYENMAFSEEDENRATVDEPAADSGNVKAKKMFFEQQSQSSLEDNAERLPKEKAGVDIRIEKLPRVIQQFEELIDKSEVESSEKKKQCSVEDTEDPSTATPIDILLTNGCSVDGSADSTRSESDFTPEELRSVSELSAEAVSESVDSKSLPKSDFNQSISAVTKESEGNRLANIDNKLSSPKADFPVASSAKSPSLEETTQPDANKCITISDTDAQKTKSICEKLPSDKLSSVETKKSSTFVDKLPSETKTRVEEFTQDKLAGEVEEPFEVTKEFRLEDATKQSKLTSIEITVDEKNENMTKQATDEKLKIPIPQKVLEKSVGLGSDSLTSIVQDPEKHIISDKKSEDIAKCSENVDGITVNENIKSNDASTVSSLKSKIYEPSERIEKAASISQTVCMLESTGEGSVKDIVTSVEKTNHEDSLEEKHAVIEEIKIPNSDVKKIPAHCVEESVIMPSSVTISQTDDAIISDKSSPSTILKSISVEESQTILEKVISSEIPVTSVITTKRISCGDSSSTDSREMTSKKTPQKDLDEHSIERKCDVSTFSKPAVAIERKISDKSICVEKTDAVDSKTPELPLTETTTTTTIITTERSEGLTETRTIEEKVILDPYSAIIAPLTSVTKTEHIDEFPERVSKETTVITSQTSGDAEKTLRIKENIVSSTITASSINTTISGASIPIKSEVESQKMEKTFEETISTSLVPGDTIVATKQTEKISADSIDLVNKSLESTIPSKQPEKAASKIPKPNESSHYAAEKTSVDPSKPKQLLDGKSETRSDKDSKNKISTDISPRSGETVTKEEIISVSNKPKLESTLKTGPVSCGSDGAITSTSITESNISSKDIKMSSVRESRIPVRKTISREKSNDSINYSKGSKQLSSLPTEQLESNFAISTSCDSPESKSTEKEFKSITSKLSCEMDVASPIESNLKIVTVPEESKHEVSSTIQHSKSSSSVDPDLSSSNFGEKMESITGQPSKSKRDSELDDISTDIKVCDRQILSSSSVHEDNSSPEGDDISDEQIVTFGLDNKRISITENEAIVAAENLIDEIETELNQRPDLVENLLLSQMDLLCQDTNDIVADDSNDITDEDLRSTGTEVDIAMPDCSDFVKLPDNTCEQLSKSGEIRISEASPTEYEINYEQVEEFSIPESTDFEERVITETSDPNKENWKDSSFGLENQLEHTAAKPPIPESAKKPSTPSAVPEIRRKSSEESALRTDILSPESGSSDTPSKRYEDAVSSPSLVVTTRIKKHHETDPCSSSSESHYHSFTSRPCSSDVEGMLSLSAVPGSSEYETAASRDTSSYSHEFHTAVSSASIHDSLKSIDSESSGHLGSAEVSSEVSETLVPSSGELEHDIDFPGGVNVLFDDAPRNIYSKTFLEPYDQDIPINVIKGTAQVEGTRSNQSAYKLDAIYSPLLDERLESSCEDMSSLSTTDGGANVQTVVEVPSTESEKMDNSLTSDQTSLTMSALSNQLSISSSDFKDEVETDRKTVDTNTMSSSHSPSAGPGSTTSVTLLTSVSEDQGRHNVNTQVTSNIESSIVERCKSPDISPDDESFELIEKPDLLDDFVVIEEVAKEACEFDTEGRSIRIIEKRKSNNFDDDILLPPPQTASTLTHVEYYEPGGGAGDEACSFEKVTFEEKRTSDQSYENSPPDDSELYAREVEEGKKWIEMQFQTDSEATAYEYGYERVPLEDIKEEDTDDMQSSKVGSVSSQISQSIGSLGSMKQSLSSTPDYDILAGKRYFTKSAEPDTVSQSSLQEFERLEQLMALESMKGRLSASQDSISSGSNEKKCSIAGDDVSVSSLKEFEGLELACGEMDKIEERAKAEEHCLSQIEEGHESQASESESCETLEKSCYESDVDEDDYDKKMFEIDEIIRQAQSNVEKFADRLEKTESLGRGDSFEETSRLPELELDLPLQNPSAAIQHTSGNLYSGKKYIENVDLSHSLTESTDSLELKPGCVTSKYLDDPVTSTDSLEGGSSGSRSKLDIASDSLDNRVESPRSEATELLVHDEYESAGYRLSPNQISSPDSADATSSTATHATYQNDSIMSSSFTSIDSNTMVSSSENLEHVVSSYSSWLEGGQQATTSVTTTKHAELINAGYETQMSTTRRTVEMPMELEGVKVVYKGPQAKKLLEQEIASFKPGEYVTETREVDADGRVRVRRVIETRTVLTSEQVESARTSLKKGGIVGDVSGGPASCSKVTTTIVQSDLTLAGPASESSFEQEKKKDAVEDTSKDTKKKTK